MLAIYIQAFVSTKLVPGKVLVWTPLTLILDAGSLLQIFVLLIEEISFDTFVHTLSSVFAAPWRLAVEGQRHKTSDLEERAAQETGIFTNPPFEPRHLIQSLGTSQDVAVLEGTISIDRDSCTKENSAQEGPKVQVRTQSTDAGADAAQPDEPQKLPYGKTVIALLGLVLLLMVVVVQAIALHAALRGQKVANLQATWCCPMFAPLVLAVLDGDCVFHKVVERQVWGNGCISLPADQQRDWLRGTIVLVSLALVFQAFDCAVLTLVHKDRRWSEVKMKRPWLTMFGGILVLILITAYGTFYASRLPNGVTELVWVFHWDVAGNFSQVCTATLASSRLRGAFISWLDGLFDSWDATYYGF